MTDLEKYMTILPEAVQIIGTIEDRSIELDGVTLPISHSLRIINKSSDFCWGYAGSGPSQLALAICMHYLPVKYAIQFYQSFKVSYVAALPKGDFSSVLNFKQEIQKIIDQRTNES